MALAFRNKKLSLLMIIVLIAFPYVSSETISHTLPTALATSYYSPLSAGPNYPGTASSSMWNGINGVQGSSINTCATTTGKGGDSRLLDLTNFGFNIPSTSIVTGIQVGVKIARTNTNVFTGQLLSGSPAGDVKSFARSSSMATTCATSSLINISLPSDLWNSNWTAAQINSNSFGVEINSGQGGGNRFVDLVSVTVYYYVPDTTPPVIDSNLNATAEATSSAGATVTYIAPVTTDNFDPPGVATCTPASGSTFALGDTKVTCTATDLSGNSATPTTFNVHVQDTTPPVISIHLPITMEATDSSGAVVTYIAPATHDAVDGDKVTTCTPVSGSTFALGNTKVTCTAKDAAGNSASSSFDIFVQDTTAPVIAKNTDITAEATGATLATITATGGAGTGAVVNSVGNNGIQVNITGTTTYYGGGGGGGSNTFGCSGVTNNGGLGGGGHGGFGNPTTGHDSCSPAQAGINGLGGGGGAGYFDPSANGGSGIVIISYHTGALTATGGTITTSGGNTIHTFTTNGTFTVTSGSANIKVLVVGGGGGGINHVAGSGGGINYVESYLVTPNSFVITIGAGGIHDSGAVLGTGGKSAFTPLIAIAPNLGGNTAVAFTAPTATDTVSTPTVTCDHASGSMFPLGHTKVTCTAKDAAGNSASSSFDVFVQDTTAPVIAKNIDIVAEATSSSGAAVTYTAPTATDAVSIPTVTCDHASGSVFPLGHTKVICTAKDAAGNLASSSFDVLVQDTTVPTIAKNIDIVAEATSSAGATVTYTAPVIKDNVDPPGVATCTKSSGSTFALGDTKVTCTAKDTAGNSATSTIDIVLLHDTTATIVPSHDTVT